MVTDRKPSISPLLAVRLYAFLLLLVGGVLAWEGGHLLALGGSPYYVGAGLLVVSSAIALALGRPVGVILYGVMLAITLVWALWEAGLDGWALAPRLIGPFALGAPLLLPAIRRAVQLGDVRIWPRTLAVFAICVVAGLSLHGASAGSRPSDPMLQAGQTAWSGRPTPDPGSTSSEWLHYGNDPGATRYSPLTQISPANVGALEPVWTARLGAPEAGLEVTPLMVKDRLYACNGHNDVTALDAETGQTIWRFRMQPDLRNMAHPVCRGVAYYRAPGQAATCAERIYVATIDARLVALDASSGRPCAGFGSGGTVSLRTGMGELAPGYYFVTSAPTLVRGKLVIGGWVLDDQSRGEPSGVVRAYDAVTGQLAWAWDVGRPARGAPRPGETYTRGTPNVWGPTSADEDLGLVYLPTGSPTPDYWGEGRRPFDERYGTSLVALDAETGEEKWVFQTVHHDLWDYDNPSAPSLVDLPRDGRTVRALVLPTKTGELFVLDRTTGAPIFPVVERPAPQRGVAPGETLSPTQPFSVGLPSFRGALLRERDMWGVTPLDQLWCRIRFRQARSEGIYTPPGLKPAIAAPGYAGGMEWGGVAIDLSRRIAVVNSNHLPSYIQLIPRAEADRLGLRPATPSDPQLAHFGVRVPQAGTPYGARKGAFLSPLGMPCTQPPYGRLSAVSLDSGKLIWSRRLGAAREVGPFGIRSQLPFALGTFNLGGAVTTRTGLTFIASAQDRYLRAYETATGRELWRAPLRTGGQATPLTYISPRSGRQFVVIAAGGAAGAENARGDYLQAFALKNR